MTFLPLNRDVRFSAPVVVDPSSWRESVGSVTVPEGAGRLVVAGVSGQQNQDDHVWFDDVLEVLLVA